MLLAAGWGLRDVGQNIHMCCLQVAWASSKDGDWVLRGKHFERESQVDAVTFYYLGSEATGHCFAMLHRSGGYHPDTRGLRTCFPSVEGVSILLHKEHVTRDKRVGVAIFRKYHLPQKELHKCLQTQSVNAKHLLSQKLQSS